MRSLPLLVSYESRESVVRALAAELGLDHQERETAAGWFHRGFPPLTRRDWLPFLFGVSPKLIGAMSAKSGRYYRHFQLEKKKGGHRRIVTPRRFLKTVQRWLAHNVLVHLPRRDNVHGFVKGRNILTNAAPHLGGRNLLAVDIRDFFPSVREARVREVLGANLPYSESVVAQIAGLCTLDGALPQGAPTSPALANSVFHDADGELASLAEDWGCQYTRYADDLAFSGDRSFNTEDIEVVQAIVSDWGFALHTGKSRIVGPGGRQVVAGLVVNEKGLPPRKTRRRWRAMFHRADHYPHEFRDRVNQLFGVASFVNQFSPEVAGAYFGVARKVLALRDEGLGD